jgi:hypothetical protein
VEGLCSNLVKFDTARLRFGLGKAATVTEKPHQLHCRRFYEDRPRDFSCERDRYPSCLVKNPNGPIQQGFFRTQSPAQAILDAFGRRFLVRIVRDNIRGLFYGRASLPVGLAFNIPIHVDFVRTEKDPQDQDMLAASLDYEFAYRHQHC